MNDAVRDALRSWLLVFCLFKKHDYEEVDRGAVDDVWLRLMAASEPSIKYHDVDGKPRAYDLICKRCGKIEGFQHSQAIVGYLLLFMVLMCVAVFTLLTLGR